MGQKSIFILRAQLVMQKRPQDFPGSHLGAFQRLGKLHDSAPIKPDGWEYLQLDLMRREPLFVPSPAGFPRFPLENSQTLISINY